MKIFLRHLHFDHNHHHLDYLWSIVQMGFVVLALRATLRATERCCFICRKRKARTLHPMMSELSDDRPFSICDSDYFGLFYVTIRRTSEKRWAFVETTRVVHIKNVPSMDTGSCVMGIERLFTRHSTPGIVWSDNGTNLVGA